MNRVLGVRLLQEWPTTVNIPPSNSNKFLLQTDIDQAITLGRKFSSQQRSKSSSTSSRKRTLNPQHKPDEATVVPPISSIHIPDRRARVDVDE